MSFALRMSICGSKERNLLKLQESLGSLGQHCNQDFRRNWQHHESERLERQQANAISKEQLMKSLKTCQPRSIQSESWQKNLAHHIVKRDLGLFPYKMKSRQLLEPEHIRKRLA
jgi:hypothetical protein